MLAVFDLDGTLVDQARAARTWAREFAAHWDLPHETAEALAPRLSERHPIGVRKPDPAIFHALADRLGCRLDGWMVGDSLEHDIVGGAAVGLRTVLIASDPDDAEGPVLPTLRAADTAEAIDAILAATG